MNNKPEDSAKALNAATEAAAELKSLREDREAKSGLKLESKTHQSLEVESSAPETGAPTEVLSEEKPIDPRQFTEVELEQMKMGWDPDKENGVSASEFKRVGEIIAAKRSASNEAKELREALANQDKKLSKVVKYYEDVEKAAYIKAKADLEAELENKVLEGDIQGVRAVKLKQDTLDSRQAQQQNVQQEAPEFVVFKDEFKDVLAGTSAVDIAIQGYISKRAADYQTSNPNIDPKVALDSIRAGIKEAFPQRYASVNPNQAKPAKVSTSTVSSNTKQYSLAALDGEQRMIFDQIKKADPSQTVQKFMERLKAAGRIS